MRILKLLPKILICLLIFVSCSSSNESEPDIIIGQWKVIEHYEFDIPVEVTICDANWIIEFSSNGRVHQFPDDLDIEANECPLRIGDLLNWINKGNNQYEIRLDGEEGEIYTFYKDGVNLISEFPNGETKMLYKPY